MSRADTTRTTESEKTRKFYKRLCDGILKVFCPLRKKKKKPKSPDLPEKGGRSMFTFPE